MEDNGVLVYIRNPYDKAQIWVTNGIGKRHVLSTQEIDFMKYMSAIQGVANLDKNSMGPVDIDITAFDKIPTFI